MPIAPTLVIGLGGTGSQIIEKVHEKVQETRSGQSERIAFVAFDTDINDLAEIKRRTPSIKTVQTSTRATVGEYLDINENARDNWFPVNEMLNRKTLTEGAAQVRAISRLAFDTVIKGGRLAPLHEAIDELFRLDKDQEEQALRVTITSSLAGGTGSGLILPVAMYLGNYLRAKYPRARAITRGFFVQPDVFYTVIRATEEQRNLQVNAYAAVRELDAFLMKGDNTLDDQYASLQFEFPQVSGDDVDTVSAMPYDFCFLFDATNSSGSGLDSFSSYKDHAATCIYTQSIGPMSKKHNSREDNVLREVIKHDGRNRYAGAGASRLYFPSEHLRDFVAYKWASQALSSQWLAYDDQIRERQRALDKQRESGFSARDLDLPQEFIDLVDTAASQKDPFARAIAGQCTVWDDDGLNKVTDRWLEYVTQLKAFVEQQATQRSDANLRQTATIQAAGLVGNTQPANYVIAYDELKRYHDLTQRRTEEFAGVMAYTLFKAEGSGATKDGRVHQLETYLREKTTGKFVHPVAARFFLYNTLTVLQQQRQLAGNELGRTEDYFKSFANIYFPNPKDPAQAGNGAVWLSEFKRSFMDKVRRRPGAELDNMAQQANNYVRRVEVLRDQFVWVKVLDAAIEYVSGLCKSFEILFSQLDSNLRELTARVEDHATKFDGLTGSTTRYVLADSDSLNFMYESMPYTGGVLNLDSSLAEGIYMKVRQHHMLQDEKDADFFQDLYEQNMLGYFKDQVDERHGAQIDFDIIEALEREYRAKTHDYKEDNVAHFVVAEIEKVKRLAAPFIEHPIGEEKHPIEACAYSPDIVGVGDPRRKALVDEHLGNYGGQLDSDISPQEILFYNAIFGIRARDLSKYSPERASGAAKRPAGAYFSAYYNLVAHIKPEVTETRVITPHIDRRWHTIVMLPDLDEANQDAQFFEIHSAFFGGLALKIIERQKVHDETHLYRYSPLNEVAQDFLTSNGTPCDKFYEVLDALAINPVATAQVNEAVGQEVTKYLDRHPAPTFAGSPLANALNAPGGLWVPELRSVLPSLGNSTITLFDVPAFYAISAPKDSVSDRILRRLTTDVLTYVAEQIDAVEESDQVATTLGDVLKSSLTSFRGNWPAYIDAAGEPFGRRLRTMLGALRAFADERQLAGIEPTISQFQDELRS